MNRRVGVLLRTRRSNDWYYFNLYDAGHFALVTHGKEIADKIREFLDQHVKK